MAAGALGAKHPCLKEAGSETGWNGWKNSIKFKMGNFKNKMRLAGVRRSSLMLEKEVEVILKMNLHIPTLKDPSVQKSTCYPTFPMERILQALSSCGIQLLKK